MLIISDLSDAQAVRPYFVSRNFAILQQSLQKMRVLQNLKECKHNLCDAVQIAESRRLVGVTIPVRRVAEGGAMVASGERSPR